MSITSTLELIVGVRPNGGLRNLAAFPRWGTSSTESLKAGNNSPSSPANSKLRLGEAVRHSRFGDGQVVANWPDGTLLVRFDNLAENRLVWPSFLARENGRGR